MNWKNTCAEWWKINKEGAGGALCKVYNDAVFSEGLCAWRNGDYSKAYSRFSSVKNTNPIASYYVGCMHLSGRGAPMDYCMAIESLLASAQFVPQAQLTLGTIFKSSIPGVPADKALSYSFYNLAASTDDEYAQQERDALAEKMSEEEILNGQKLSREFLSKCPNWIELMSCFTLA